MSMTHKELTDHDKEIRRIFRGWTLSDSVVINESMPNWLSSEEYELIHKCIREAHEILLKKEFANAYKS